MAEFWPLHQSIEIFRLTVEFYERLSEDLSRSGVPNSALALEWLRTIHLTTVGVHVVLFKLLSLQDPSYREVKQLLDRLQNLTVQFYPRVIFPHLTAIL